LGVPKQFFTEYTDPEVTAAFKAAVAVLNGLGAHVEDVELPALDNAWSTIAQVILNGEANAWHESYLATQAADYGPGGRKFLERGKSTGAVDYVRAQRAKVQLCRDMEAAFANVDALLTPGELVPPPLHEARTATIDGREVSLMAALISAMCPFNLTGQPALTVPCGFTKSQLPLALQIVGKAFDEATVLQIGHAYEQQTSWHRQRPPLTLS